MVYLKIILALIICASVVDCRKDLGLKESPLDILSKALSWLNVPGSLQNQFLKETFNRTLDVAKSILAKSDPFVLQGTSINAGLFTLTFTSIIVGGFSDFVLQDIDVNMMEQIVTTELLYRNISVSVTDISLTTKNVRAAIEFSKAQLCFGDLTSEFFLKFNVLAKRIESLNTLTQVQHIKSTIDASVFGVPLRIDGEQPFLVELFNTASLHANILLDLLIRLAVNVALVYI